MKVLSALGFCLVLLGACASPDSQSSPSTTLPPPISSIENPVIDAPSLAGNRLGDPALVPTVVYLPPDYASHPDKRYPVLYHLNSFDDRPRQIARWQRDLDEAMGPQGDQAFIVVEPDAYNSLFGSLFANSPVSGNWEDFVANELVAWVDAHYRTRAERTGRALSGFYTGGAAAVLIGMKHPDTFARVLAFSPALMPDGSLQADMDKNWHFSLARAYGAAFAPDLQGARPWAGIPKFDGSPTDAALIDRWESGWGHLEQKVEAYRRQAGKLDYIEIRVGVNDAIPWLYRGCLRYDALMKAAGLPIQLVVNTNGGDAHELTMDWRSGPEVVVPFMKAMAGR
jgi:hypothetical protein